MVNWVKNNTFGTFLINIGVSLLMGTIVLLIVWKLVKDYGAKIDTLYINSNTYIEYITNGKQSD